MVAFSEIIGQQHVTRVLANSIRFGRVANAYVFAGPAGVGKTSTAIAFSRVLNCESAASGNCPGCATCSRILAGVHPDVRRVSPDGNSIKIEQVRELQKWLSLRAFEARYRVAIIESAGALTQQAANAALKIIEEPPANVVFVLETEVLEDLLPTVISRCIVFRFRGLTVDEISRALQTRLQLAPGESGIIARMSKGSLGRALSAASGDLIEKRNQVADIAARIKRMTNRQIMSLSSFWEQDKESVAERLELLVEWYRDLLIVNESDKLDYVTNADLPERLLEQSRLFTAQELVSGIRDVEETRKAIEGNANLRTALDVMFLRLRKGV